MKYLLIAALFISHPSPELTWNDYNKRPTSENGIVAYTVTEWKLNDSSVNGRIYFEVVCNFVPEGSWTATSSPEILRHEIAHVSLYKIYSRIFAKEIERYQGCTESKRVKVTALFNAAWKRSEAMQKLFDKESQHGMNPITENIWENNIKKEYNEKAN